MDDTMGSSDSTEVASAQTPASKPPPESSTVIITRRFIVVAFWAVVVLFGLPHWLWTTSIHRAELPLSKMNAWAEGNACQLHYPIHVQLSSGDLDTAHLAILSQRVEHNLAAHFAHMLLNFTVTWSSELPAPGISSSDDNALTVRLIATDANDDPSATLQPWATIMDVRYNAHSADGINQLTEFLSDEIISLYYDELTSIFYLLRDGPFSPDIGIQLSDEQTKNLEKRITRAFKYAPTYHLTFSLFTPGPSPTGWEIEGALDRYILPLLDILSPISQITVDSQVQLYASFSPSISGPRHDPDDDKWKLQHEDLSGFINAAEWPLSPSIGPGPTVNLVLYVPSASRSPLVINGSTSTNWIIPQWGGVQIHDNSKSEKANLSLEDLEEDMLVFADQLTSLLGLPPTPSSLALRISSLTRQRATSAILSTSSTLGALSRLTLKLTSIAIPDSVARSVDETIARLDSACSHLRAGRFQRALEDARVAEAEAEKAFFEPSMVGQVYFPEEHKVAVYVPLLGPIAVPMLMALIKEIKTWKNAKVKTG